MGRPLTTLPRYLDAGGIAEWRERSKATVYAWTRANKIQVDHVRESDGVSMYDTSDVAFWLDGPPSESEPVEGEREDADYGREHAELERAKRELAEIKVQEARGILINAAAARKVVADVGASTRQRVLGIIPRGRDVLASMDSPHEVDEWLSRELREALTMTESDVLGGK
jgi:phage terminase Nu1 subunit (DNA packaging protein)